MIKVQFKNCYSNKYEGKNYAYQDYENAAVGDIVVVNTVNGYAIAKVVEINVTNYYIDLKQLSTVEKVIITDKEIKQKEKEAYEKKVKINNFIQRAKRTNLMNKLTEIAETNEERELLKSLDEDILEKMVNVLNI